MKDFKELWVHLDADEKRELAAKSDTSVAYLSQVANGQRRAGRKTIGSLVSADDRISFEMFFSRKAANVSRQASA